MATENNWLRSNIRDRLINQKSPFIVRFDHVDYTAIPFADASDNVIQKLTNKYDKIFVPLSGGMDSEYVFNRFIGHKFTPIIVDTPANKEESAYAFSRCKDANIKPVVIKKSERELIDIYYNEIYKKLGGFAINSVAALVAGKYADDNGGIAVIAEHGFDGINEHDFYNDALIHEDNSIYFFMYDIQIFSAMIKEYQYGENHQIFKHRLYGIPLRPKMKYKYSSETNEVIKQIRINST